MKMYYGNTPVNSLNINYFERDTNDCDMVASDLQTGKTAVARGQKITGTGKSFEFAQYGGIDTNLPMVIPNTINVIEIASITYPIRTVFSLTEIKNLDFSIPQTAGYVIVDGSEFPITVTVTNNMLTLSCDQTITLQVFYGKDNYA